MVFHEFFADDVAHIIFALLEQMLVGGFAFAEVIHKGVGGEDVGRIVGAAGSHLVVKK